MNFDDLDDENESKSGKMKNLRDQTKEYIDVMMKTLEKLPRTVNVAISLMHYYVNYTCITRFPEVNPEQILQKCIEVTFEKIIGDFLHINHQK